MSGGFSPVTNLVYGGRFCRRDIVAMSIPVPSHCSCGFIAVAVFDPSKREIMCNKAHRSRREVGARNFYNDQFLPIIANREYSIAIWYHGDPIKDPLELLHLLQQYGTEVYKGGPIFDPIMPKRQ